MHLTKQGHKPIFYYIKSELSNQTKIMLKQTFGATIEQVCPYCHRQNAAKRACHTVKNHVIPMLAGSYEKFLFYL